MSVPEAKASELEDMQLSTLSAAAASAAIEALGGFAAPIRPLQDTMNSPEFAGLPTHQSCTHPVGGEQQLVSSPWLTDGERAPIRRPAPVLGADNDYVLREVIGLPAAEAAEAAASAALREPANER